MFFGILIQTILAGLGGLLIYFIFSLLLGLDQARIIIRKVLRR